MLAKLIVLTAGSAVIVLGGAACSSERVVDKGDLAKEVSSQLAGDAGRTPESVTCPEDLAAKPGTVTTCTLSDSGETYGVKVTVTSVENDNVKFDIKVDDEPKKS